MSTPFLGICAIVKNEGAYIHEWLTFHRAIGVERFTLYNNGSSDDTLDEIRRFHYPVEVIPWPGAGMQTAAYDDMIVNRRSHAEWVAFIDADEFLTPRGEISVPDYFRRLPADVGAVYVNWLCFGSSGQTEHLPGLVTERFQRRELSNFGPNRIGKSIVRMADALDIANVHIIRTKTKMVTTAGDIIDQTKNPRDFGFPACHDAIAIHHYFTKSWAEWKTRRALGPATRWEGRRDSFRSPAQFHAHDANNVFDDTAAQIMRRAAAD